MGCLSLARESFFIVHASPPVNTNTPRGYKNEPLHRKLRQSAVCGDYCNHNYAETTLGSWQSVRVMPEAIESLGTRQF